MGNSKTLVLSGLALLIVGGALTLWLLPGSTSPAEPVGRVAQLHAAPEVAPGFDGKAPPAAPGEAHPMQFAPDSVAGPAAGQAPSLAAAAPAKPSAPVHITGRVIDEGGRPVKGAAVTFLDSLTGLLGQRDDARKLIDKAPHAETGFDGRFKLDATVPLQRDSQPPDFVMLDLRSRLVVRQDEFATLVHSCGDIAPGDYDAGDLQLEPGAWILGRVADSAGRAVSGAEVRARNDDTNGPGGRRGGRNGGPGGPGGMFGGMGSVLDAVTTGADGRFVVRGLRPGTAELTARKDGLRLGDVPDIELEARVPRDIGDVVLESGASISGVVTDSDGAPLAGSEVSVSSMTRLVVNRIEDLPRSQAGQEFGQRAVADQQGRFEISGLGGGTYNVHVNADGFAPLSREDIPAGTTNLRLQPVRLGALLLSILDSKTGKPVEGARIKATPSGDNPMRFWQPQQPAPVLAGAEALKAAGPVASAGTDAASAYLVRDAGIDGTDLVIAADHYATQAVTAPAVPSRETVPFVVRLVPESMVAGRVLDENKQPVDGATVRLKKAPLDDQSGNGRGFRNRVERTVRFAIDDNTDQPDADTMSARTGADGRFELRGAAAGDWNLTASAAGRVASDPLRITLSDGTPQPDVDIILQAAGSIAGVVTEADGTPAADIEVVVEPRAAPAPAAGDDSPEAQVKQQLARMFGNRDGSGNGPRRVRTDTSGTYQVTNLAAGDYGVSISSGPRRGRNFGPAVVVTLDGSPSTPDDSATSWTKVVAGAESRVNLVRPKRGVVTGTVTAGGQPAANVSVALRRQQSQGFFFGGGGDRTDTDEQGVFRFDDVEAGSYTVSGQAPGAALEERAPVSLEAGQEKRVNLDFSGSSLSGQVVEAGGSKGAAGVLLRVQPVADGSSGGSPGGGPGGGQAVMQFITATNTGGPPNGMSLTVGGGRAESAHTDANGKFTLHYIKPGRYTIEASGSGYMRTTTGPIEVKDNENKDDLRIEVTPGAVVQGVIVSGSTGDRLDKVPVRLEGGDRAQMTVTDKGSYRFDGLNPGDYTVNVLGSGFGSDAIASGKVKIEKNGEVQTLDLTTKQS